MNRFYKTSSTNNLDYQHKIFIISVKILDCLHQIFSSEPQQRRDKSVNPVLILAGNVMKQQGKNEKCVRCGLKRGETNLISAVICVSCPISQCVSHQVYEVHHRTRFKFESNLLVKETRKKKCEKSVLFHRKLIYRNVKSKM